ncbi:MAG: hypothetical protein ACYCX3_15315 [Thermoleophilia bacterium]
MVARSNTPVVVGALLREDLAAEVDAVLLDEKTLVVKFKRPIASLVHRATSMGGDDAGLQVLPRDRYRFTGCGEYYSITFEHSEFNLQRSNGLAHLARLLRHPGEEIPAVVLVTRLQDRTLKENDPEEDSLWDLRLTTGDPGLPTFDQQAAAAYRARLDEIEDESERARVGGDAPTLARLEAERSGLERALAAGLDHRGRPRLTHATAERARQNVQRAIAAAIKKIGAQDPDLGVHMRQSIVTGVRCAYRPANPIPWMFQ